MDTCTGCFWSVTMSCIQRALPMLQLVTKSHSLGIVNQIIDSNGQAIYLLAVDFIAYRIAWHLFQLEQAEETARRHEVYEADTGYHAR